MNLATFNKKSFTCVLAGLLIACFLVMGSPLQASAAPGIPAAYGGTVTIGGALSGAGHTVTAKIDGEVVGEATTDTSSEYALTVVGSDGDIIYFYIGTTKAGQSATYASGEITKLNLTVSSASQSEGDDDLAISTTSLSSGTVGTYYSRNLSATGGSGSYAWSLLSGELPGDLSLSSAGVLEGLPDTAGLYSFTIQVADDESSLASHSFSLTIYATASQSSTPTTAPTSPTTPTTAPASSGTTATGTTGDSGSTTSAAPASAPNSSQTASPAGTPQNQGNAEAPATPTTGTSDSGDIQWPIVIAAVVGVIIIGMLIRMLVMRSRGDF